MVTLIVYCLGDSDSYYCFQFSYKNDGSMTIKHALAIIKSIKKEKTFPFKRIIPPDLTDALTTLSNQNRCMQCGKKLKLVGICEWMCPCWKEGLRMSKG